MPRRSVVLPTSLTTSNVKADDRTEQTVSLLDNVYISLRVKGDKTITFTLNGTSHANIGIINHDVEAVADKLLVDCSHATSGPYREQLLQYGPTFSQQSDEEQDAILDHLVNQFTLQRAVQGNVLILGDENARQTIRRALVEQAAPHATQRLVSTTQPRMVPRTRVPTRFQLPVATTTTTQHGIGPTRGSQRPSKRPATTAAAVPRKKARTTRSSRPLDPTSHVDAKVTRSSRRNPTRHVEQQREAHVTKLPPATHHVTLDTERSQETDPTEPVPRLRRRPVASTTTPPNSGLKRPAITPVPPTSRSVTRSLRYQGPTSHVLEAHAAKAPRARKQVALDTNSGHLKETKAMVHCGTGNQALLVQVLGDTRRIDGGSSHASPTTLTPQRQTTRTSGTLGMGKRSKQSIVHAGSELDATRAVVYCGNGHTFKPGNQTFLAAAIPRIPEYIQADQCQRKKIVSEFLERFEFVQDGCPATATFASEKIAKVLGDKRRIDGGNTHKSPATASLAARHRMTSGPGTLGMGKRSERSIVHVATVQEYDKASFSDKLVVYGGQKSPPPPGNVAYNQRVRDFRLEFSQSNSTRRQWIIKEFLDRFEFQETANAQWARYKVGKALHMKGECASCQMRAKNKRARSSAMRPEGSQEVPQPLDTVRRDDCCGVSNGCVLAGEVNLDDTLVVT